MAHKKWPDDLKDPNVDPKMAAQFKAIEKKLQDFSEEHQALFICMILVPTDTVRENWDWARELKKGLDFFGFVTGFGPNRQLVKILAEKTKDVDDGWGKVEIIDH